MEYERKIIRPERGFFESKDAVLKRIDSQYADWRVVAFGVDGPYGGSFMFIIEREIGRNREPQRRDAY
jgi:hypothetical protein